MLSQRISPIKPETRLVRLDVDAETSTYWAFMHQSSEQKMRPCCTLGLLSEAVSIQSYVNRVRNAGRPDDAENLQNQIVIASDANAFCLGGDLELFVKSIRNKDRSILEDYASKCVDVIHGFHMLSATSTHTIALIQGDALGGGFELALACDSIIAEEQTVFGFPEVYFGLFPAMGAYQFLRKRTNPQFARRMMLERRTYSAEELHTYGIIDQIVPRGMGVTATEEHIFQQRRAEAAHIAVSQIHYGYERVKIEEMRAVTEKWVDCALALTPKSLATMERLIAAQRSRFETADENRYFANS